MKKLLLVGGGGHCKSVLDSLLFGNCAYDEIGIIDIQSKIGQEICGIKIIGEDNDLKRFYEDRFNYAFITLGSIGSPHIRMEAFQKIKRLGFTIPNIQDPSSIISHNAKLNEGIYIGKNAVINSNAQIGACSIVNTGVIIEHDCVLGSFVHAAPGSTVCGGAKLGDETHVGAGATVIQNIEIGRNVLIGAGTVVVKNVMDNSKIVGNPGRVLNENSIRQRSL